MRLFGRKNNGVPKVTKGGKKKYKNGDITFEEGIYGNVWFRMMSMAKAGSKKTAHKHTFDHVHFIVSGEVSVYSVEDGENGEVKKTHIGNFKAPQSLEVPAGKAHEVESLTDDTVALCVQAVRGDDGEILETDYINGSKDVEITKL